MTVRRERQRLAGVKKRLCLVLACVVLTGTGCGQRQEAAQWKPEDVELLEPVGVSQSYETAARRNLYDAQTFYAQVCPYVEEYQLNGSFVFDRYGALPGEQVKKGDALLHSDYKPFDDQIESMEKSIAAMDEDYREFLEQDRKSREKALADQQGYAKVLQTLEKEKPEEFLTDALTGEQTRNPAYDQWYNKPYGYRDFDSRYHQVCQTILELDEALKERTELYELDREYALLCLERVKEDRKRGTLSSGMDGYVAGVGAGNSYYGDLLRQGDQAPSGMPLAAVCDPSRLEIRSQYLTKYAYQNAEEVYAIVGGKRYEVEYMPIETAEEYEKKKEENGGTVYGVFYPVGDTQDLKLGDYAVIVVKNKTRENVVTIPSDALVKEGKDYYAYVMEGDAYVYTKVEVGMSDSMYTEIVSGIEEGDRVRTQKAVTAGGETVKVTRGRLCTEVSTTGTLLYPYTEWVTNPVKYGTCYLVKSLFHAQQAVKKGDVLAEIRVVPDQAEIDRKEMQLRREKERLQDLIEEGNEEENKKLIAAKQETIKELEELLADMKADAATTQIVAPRDGIIRRSYYYELTENEILSPDMGVCLISDQQVMYLNVENKDNQLAYGSTVTVKYKDKNQVSHLVEGKVVTAGAMSLSASMYEGKVLVKLSQEDFAAMAEAEEERYASVYSFQVTAEVRVMEDVLLVPKEAVAVIGKNCYVKVKLETGEIQYRSFLAGGADGDNYWAMEGLTEGMELCLD